MKAAENVLYHRGNECAKQFYGHYNRTVNTQMLKLLLVFDSPVTSGGDQLAGNFKYLLATVASDQRRSFRAQT